MQKAKTFTKAKERMFVIFFPNDVHMPGLYMGNSLSVNKLVIKVLTN